MKPKYLESATLLTTETNIKSLKLENKNFRYFPRNRFSADCRKMITEFHNDFYIKVQITEILKCYAQIQKILHLLGLIRAPMGNRRTKQKLNNKINQQLFL